MTFTEEFNGMRIEMTKFDFATLLGYLDGVLRRLFAVPIKGLPPDHFVTLRAAIETPPMCQIDGESVVLRFVPWQYDILLMCLGAACGGADGTPLFWEILQFLNEMNTGNPRYAPYEIPADKLPLVQ